jgi:hypothetical protein
LHSLNDAERGPADLGDEIISPELVLVDPDLSVRARALLPWPDPTLPARRPAAEIVPPAPAEVPVAAVPARVAEPPLRFGGRVAAAAALVPALVVLALIGEFFGRSASPLGATTANQSSSQTGPEATAGPAPRSPFRPPRRPPAFHLPGAPKEPLDEMTLPARARRLEAWLRPSRSPTAANLHHWLYQHAWIVTGARFGWWHGAQALRILIRVDRRVASQWGIGNRSEAAARRALAEVEARAN